MMEEGVLMYRRRLLRAGGGVGLAHRSVDSDGQKIFSFSMNINCVKNRYILE